mgnify:FL=1
MFNKEKKLQFMLVKATKCMYLLEEDQINAIKENLNEAQKRFIDLIIAKANVAPDQDTLILQREFVAMYLKHVKDFPESCLAIPDNNVYTILLQDCDFERIADVASEALYIYWKRIKLDVKKEEKLHEYEKFSHLPTLLLYTLFIISIVALLAFCDSIVSDFLHLLSGTSDSYYVIDLIIMSSLMLCNIGLIKDWGNAIVINERREGNIFEQLKNWF